MSENNKPGLRRSLTLPLVTFYGLGTILGAGIYVLIGEVVAMAGIQAPLAFAIASLLATFSALSYAELSARYPVSAGEAVYVQKAFGLSGLSRAVGLLIVIVGMVSTATLANGFVGYFQVLLDWPDWLVITLLVLSLGAIAAWGIKQSVWVATLTTLIEMGGLLLVLWVGVPVAVQTGLAPLQGFFALDNLALLSGLLGGAFVAFYAFIGFEDIVNVAEEVRDPTRNLPRAIILALVISTLLYMAIAFTSILVANIEQLGQSDAPLALVYEQATGEFPAFITLISLTAVINGALIQIIMASRVLYGMARQGWLPARFAEVSPTTRTPLFSTLLITLVILALALWLPLLTLASATSLITLTVFTLINLALWRIKWRGDVAPGTIHFPIWVPVLGALSSGTFILLQIYQWLPL